jgi:hypothetical protein
LLAELELEHPYVLSRVAINRLSDNLSFIEGCQGTAIPLPENARLFRIGSVGHIINGCNWRGPTIAQPKCPRAEEGPRVIWDFLLRRYLIEKTWLSLSQFASGTFSGTFTRFTWWTDKEITPDRFLTTAYELGLLYDWLSPYSLILCFRSEKPAKSHVPTPMDGFISPVFDPVEGPSSSHQGKAINISDPLNICEGRPEYVLPPMDVQSISLLPIAEPWIGPQIFLDAALLKQLCQYCGR